MLVKFKPQKGGAVGISFAYHFLEKRNLFHGVTKAEIDNAGQREGREKWEEKSNTKMTGKGPSRIRKREGRGNRAQGEAGAGTAFTSDPGTRGPPSGAFLSSLLWIIHVQAPVKVLAAQSCLTLTPWTVACQAPLSRGFSRQEYWSGLPFPSPGHHPNPEIEPESPAWRANSLLPESPGKPIKYLHSINAKIWDMDKRMI